MTYQQDSTHPTGVAHIDGSKDAVVRARERKANAALQLRIAGANWDEVAEVIGFPTARQAMVAVERALERELHTEESQARMRSLAGKRLERLLRSCWAKAIDPDHPDHLLALAKAREVIDRHAKLYGLDAPTQMVVHSPTAAELEQWVAEVTGSTTKQLAEADIFGEDDVVDAEYVEES